MGCSRKRDKHRSRGILNDDGIAAFLTDVDNDNRPVDRCLLKDGVWCPSQKRGEAFGLADLSDDASPFVRYIPGPMFNTIDVSICSH